MGDTGITRAPNSLLIYSWVASERRPRVGGKRTRASAVPPRADIAQLARVARLRLKFAPRTLRCLARRQSVARGGNAAQAEASPVAIGVGSRARSRCSFQGRLECLYWAWICPTWVADATPHEKRAGRV